MEVVMAWRRSSIVVVAVAVVLLTTCQAVTATATGSDISIGSCLKTCGNNGCAAQICLPSCQYLNGSNAKDGLLESLPLYRKWNEWVCGAECRYRCMQSREAEELGFEQDAIGYRDSWCLIRVMNHQQSAKELYSRLAISSLTQGIDVRLINVRSGFTRTRRVLAIIIAGSAKTGTGFIKFEPASVAFSAVNLLVNLIGLLAFLKLVYYGLPTRPVSRGPYYPFAGFWTIYGILVTLYWFGQCIFHSRKMSFDMHLDSSIEVLVAGFTTFLAVIRVGDMRKEQARVIVMAPAVAFIFPHLMYVNLCTFDYGLNVLVCLALGIFQYLLWITWSGITRPPASPYLWLLSLFAVITLVLRSYDFSYVWAWLDVDALWILSCIPSSVLWWMFVRSDAAYLSKSIMKKSAVHKDA